MSKTQMMILFSVSIGILLFSQHVTNGLVGVVTALSTIQERHEVPVSLFVHSNTTQLTRQSYLLPLPQSIMQNLHIDYVSLANITTSSSSTSLTDIFKRVENSVVQITSRVNDTGNLQIIINGNPLQDQSTRLGSGFVYDNQGHIVTNNHVVNGAKTVDVTFVDGNTYTAKVIGTDPSSDLAVLQITDNFSIEKVVPLVIANSNTLQVGQQVIAIGNPFGLSDTMTTGIVSQTGRLLPNPDTRFPIPNGIQTDAAINPGNSGGPLLNTQGQVVGMNTAISSSTGEFSGIGFAVPSNAITHIVPKLMQNGSYTHPWLGISGGGVTPDFAQSAGLPINYKGVLVGSVQAGSPAEKAGLHGVSQDVNSNPHVGDIIVAVDGHKVKRIDDIINYMETQKSVGQAVKLTVNRNGQIMDLTAILEARPASEPPQQ
ncbi:MAG: trypsin-like peptidase domain-containing protein [Candidatus Nitrosopolaris sp.]